MQSTPIFWGRESDFETADLVWWMPKAGDAPEGWFDLRGHACNGFSIDHLDGWVLPLEPSDKGLRVLEAITEEEFARDCSPDNLDYEVTDKHREAYTQFLKALGLETGDLSQLMQAVYPLAASLSNLRALGVEPQTIPNGASLLVLGTNCD